MVCKSVTEIKDHAKNFPNAPRTTTGGCRSSDNVMSRRQGNTISRLIGPAFSMNHIVCTLKNHISSLPFECDIPCVP